MKYCAKCGQLMPDSVRFCASCGAAQPDVKLRELSDRLEHQAAELEEVRKELRKMQAAERIPGPMQPSERIPGSAPAPGMNVPTGQAGTPGMNVPSGQAGIPGRQAAPGTPGGIEFNIAATVLSLIGVVFLISALMIFGASFLSGMAQGLFLFAVFAALTAFSELWVRKRLPRFAEITSALGLAGLYAAAVINYASLKTLPEPALLAVTLLISGFAVWLSRRRDSVILRLVLLFGSGFALGMTGDEDPGMAAAVLAFLISLTAVLLPIRRNRTLCSAVHMICYAVYTIFLQLQISEWSLFGHNTLEVKDLLPVVFFLIVMEAVRLMAPEGSGGPDRKTPGKAAVWYLIAVLTVIVSLLFAGGHGMTERVMTAAMLSVPAVLGTAAGVLVLKRGTGELYRGVYTVIILWMLIGASGQEAIVVLPVCILAMGCSLLIARRDGRSSLITLHLVITVIAFLTAMTAEMPKFWFILAAAALLMFYFQPGHCSMHAAALILYAVCSIHNYHTFYGLGGYHGKLYTDLCCAALILGLTLLLQRIPGRRDRYTVLFGQLMLFLILLHHERLSDCDLPQVYILFLLVGGASVFLLCGEKLRLPGRTVPGTMPAGAAEVRPAVSADAAKVGPLVQGNAGELRIPIPGWLLYAVYLTFMILVIDTLVPVWISILLLVLACVCVGAGFRMKVRYLRLYGLGLAIFACVKIAVYDFHDLSSGMRVGVFLAAGLLALIISFIYIRLEKNA